MIRQPLLHSRFLKPDKIALGKILEGTSGFVVDAIGFPAFFTYTASLSIPGLLLLAWLTRQRLLDAHGRIATREGGAPSDGR